MAQAITTRTSCSVLDCLNVSHSGGLCSKHYSRFRRTGRTEKRTVIQRFLTHLTPQGDCWQYSAVGSRGYGQFWPSGAPVSAHRWSYEYHLGLIPSGLDLDHLCRNRACVNPWHLDPVPAVVNIRRGEGLAAVNHRKTLCIRGHKFDAANTYMTPDGRRMCRTCTRLREARRALAL